jgi:hypothetical protein
MAVAGVITSDCKDELPSNSNVAMHIYKQTLFCNMWLYAFDIETFSVFCLPSCFNLRLLSAVTRFEAKALFSPVSE